MEPISLIYYYVTLNVESWLSKRLESLRAGTTMGIIVVFLVRIVPSPYGRPGMGAVRRLRIAPDEGVVLVSYVLNVSCL